MTHILVDRSSPVPTNIFFELFGINLFCGGGQERGGASAIAHFVCLLFAAVPPFTCVREQKRIRFDLLNIFFELLRMYIIDNRFVCLLLAAAHLFGCVR